MANNSRLYTCSLPDRCNRTWDFNITSDSLTHAPSWACDILQTSLEGTGLRHKALPSWYDAISAEASPPTTLQWLVFLFLSVITINILHSPSYALPLLPSKSRSHEHAYSTFVNKALHRDFTYLNMALHRASRGAWLVFYASVYVLECLAVKWTVTLWWGTTKSLAGFGLHERHGSLVLGAVVVFSILWFRIGMWLLRVETILLSATGEGMNVIRKKFGKKGVEKERTEDGKKDGEKDRTKDGMEDEKKNGEKDGKRDGKKVSASWEILLSLVGFASGFAIASIFSSQRGVK